MSLSKIPSQEFFPADKPWEESNGKTYLRAMNCTNCGTKAFPIRSICSHCNEQDGLEIITLGTRATLYTFSEVHVAPKDFMTPYVIGFVDFDEGVRVVGQIEGTAETLTPEQKVETTTGLIKKRSDGTTVISYKFRGIK